MSFTDDQFFHAALYWAAALPGGDAFVYSMYAEYQKTHRKSDMKSIPTERCHVFFESLYGYLKEGKAEALPCPDKRLFIELGRKVFKSDDRIFCPALDHALIAAEIDQAALPQPGKVCIHDTGQIFASREQGRDIEIYEMDYPGRPVLDCKSYPSFKTTDMTQCYESLWEELYRVLHLKKGQPYQDGGSDYTVARDDLVFAILHSEASDIYALTDEEILNHNHSKPDKIKYRFVGVAEEYTPGHVSILEGGISVEATNDPRIVRKLVGPVTCMKVTERMQIHYGMDFRIAEPGDIIVANGKNRTPFIVKQKDLLSGAARLIDQTPGHALLRGSDKGKKIPSFKLKPW